MLTPLPDEPPEAARLRFEHSLQIRRIWLDRMLIGALLVIAGLVANVVLEKYRADRGQSQFFLDKRLAAATDVRRALTDVTSSLFRVSEGPCAARSVDAAALTNLNGAMGKFAETLNSASLLLDESYLTDATRTLSIFFGIAAKPDSITCDTRGFITEVARYLTHQTKLQVAPEAHAPWTRFKPIGISVEQIDEMGVDVYFSKNFEIWRANANAQK